MLIPNHPDDERLSALASGEADAAADASLTGHVSTCVRCTELVNDLGALRASLADLPDLRPSRPLQLVPAAADEARAGDPAAGWVRRLFAPVVTLGATLALVGLVGTASPALEGMAAGGAAGATAEAAEESLAALGEVAEPAASADAQPAGDGETLNAAETDNIRDYATDGRGTAAQRGDEEGETDSADAVVADERPIWPMLLFAGIAVMVGAVVLRWILAPRPAG